jgi:hypothetical protein
MHPLRETEAPSCGYRHSRYQKAAQEGNEPLTLPHPRSVGTNCIRKVGSHYETNARENGNGEYPQIPRRHEGDKVVKCQLGPLIEATFKRHQSIEKNNDSGER